MTRLASGSQYTRNASSKKHLPKRLMEGSLLASTSCMEALLAVRRTRFVQENGFRPQDLCYNAARFLPNPKDTEVPMAVTRIPIPAWAKVKKTDDRLALSLSESGTERRCGQSLGLVRSWG